jgi:hypothetical protein
MIDASTFEETEMLKNGVTVKIRAIRPADRAGLADAFGKLDPPHETDPNGGRHSRDAVADRPGVTRTLPEGS